MYLVRDWLYIGRYRETTDEASLQAQGIGAALLLAEPVRYESVQALYLQVEDGQPVAHEKLARGIAFIRAQKAAGQPVLSACGAGISRSTTFVLGALAEEEGLTWQQAYTSLLPHHPEAFPHARLVQSLIAYLGDEPPPFADLWNEITALQAGGR